MRRVGATPGGRLAVLAAAVALVATAGVAYAAIPDSGGIVHGCYATRDGSVRVIDADTSPRWSADCPCRSRPRARTSS